jgi:hypothetical protein
VSDGYVNNPQIPARCLPDPEHVAIEWRVKVECEAVIAARHGIEVATIVKVGEGVSEFGRPQFRALCHVAYAELLDEFHRRITPYRNAWGLFFVPSQGAWFPAEHLTGAMREEIAQTDQLLEAA